MTPWIGRVLRAVVFGVLTTGFVAVIRSQTGGDVEPISDFAVRALAYGLGYFIAGALLGRSSPRRRKITAVR